MGAYDDLVPGAGEASEPLRLTARPSGLDDRSRDLAIRTVYGEAGGEPPEGQRAVADVIRNRVTSGRYGGGDVASVVHAPNQFEPWSRADARSRMMALRAEDPAYQRIGSLVDEAWAGDDTTDGATHFYSPRVQTALGRQAPAWARGPLASIGTHQFYAPEGRVTRSTMVPSDHGGVPVMAAGGAYDDLVPDEPADEPPSPRLQAALGELGELSQPKGAPVPSAGRAALEGVLSGASGNFRDEVYGASAASGLPEWLGGFRAPVGAARLGLEALTGRGAASAAYEEGRDRIRGVQKAAEEAHPGLSIAGQVAGALAVPIGAGARAATLLAQIGRSAAVGSVMGAASGAGAGEDVGSRVTGAAAGAGLGAVAGAAAPVAVRAAEGAGRFVRATFSPVVDAVRGFRDPQRAAAERIVSAIDRDQRTGRGGLTPRQWEASRTAGEPVAVADLGGETTRAVARSAANTSPEGRSALERLAEDRFHGQADRASEFIRRLVGGDVDTEAVREGLRAEARAVNRPAYAAAYGHPNAQAMWDEGFQQIASAPVVQQAIRNAERTGRNRAAVDGFAPVRNPFEAGPDGYLRPRVGPDGQRMVPNLQFWDHVKRNLDDVIGAHQRAGRNAAARDAQALRSALVDHLDELVPSYRAARAGAARFFGADDALSAGEEFVRRNVSPRDVERAFREFSPRERDLFRQGFAARLIDEVQRTGYSQDVMRKIAGSPAATQKLRIALGEQGSRNLEAFVQVERHMDQLRRSLGNSTSVRQFMELGLAGGAGYTYGTGGNILNPDVGAAASASLAMALVRGRHAVDQRVARHVAEMLTSRDPAVLARGYRTVAGNRRLLEAFRNLSLPAARPAGQQAAEAVPHLGIAGQVRQSDDRER